MMIAAFAAVLLAQAGVIEPKPAAPLGASLLVDAGIVRAYAVTDQEITENSPTILVLDDGATVYNAGTTTELILIGDDAFDLPPGWMVMRGGSGHSAKSCTVTCGLVGNPPVQYFACCYTDAEGVARCLCRQPGQPDLDCTSGGSAATSCSTGN